MDGFKKTFIINNMKEYFNEAGFNTILDNLSDGLIVTNASGTIIFCNRVAAENYNMTPLKLLNKNISLLTETGIVDQSFRDLAVKTKRTITYEQICSSKNHLINKTTPIFNENDNLEFIIEQTYCAENLLFDSNFQISPYEAPANTEKSSSIYDDSNSMITFKSPAMEPVYNLADNMAPKNINILILGSSGTGKSQLAKRIHDHSTRKTKAFVTINCSTIPENLIESELFGYVKGAFSGANDKGKLGLVDAAEGGTLFLDEIGEISLSTQVKLLQLVQDKTYIPIGGIHPKHADIRIIAATNKDLFQHVRNKEFREDLFYRLAVITITIPSLSERREDIEHLIRHYTHVFNHKHGTNVSFARETVDVMLNYSWPGNIRELEHLIEFLILNTKNDYILPYMLPAEILDPETRPPHNASHHIEAETRCKDTTDENSTTLCDSFDSLDEYMEFYEGNLIRELYKTYSSSYKLASRLKISQSKASRLIKKYKQTP